MPNSTTLSYVLAPTNSSQFRCNAAAPLCIAASLVLLTSCSDSGSDAAEDPSEATEATTEPGEGTDDDDAEAGSAPEEPGALSEDQKMELLLSSEDLPDRPQSHSTHNGISYFQESIAVEYTQYQENFGQTDCAEAMDRINVDLVGESPLDGVAHAYSLPETESGGEEYSPQIYVWVLSYEDEVDSTETWDAIYDYCSGTELQTDDAAVEIQPLDLDDDHDLGVEGISMVVSNGDEPLEAASAVRHSMTVDYGDNLVVLSAVGLDSSEFEALAQTQVEKLAGAL